LICDQIATVVELLKLQNALNFAEERDKNQISLFGKNDLESFQPDAGSALDENAKNF
jgi:hypothetical protein